MSGSEGRGGNTLHNPNALAVSPFNQPSTTGHGRSLPANSVLRRAIATSQPLASLPGNQNSELCPARKPPSRPSFIVPASELQSITTSIVSCGKPTRRFLRCRLSTAEELSKEPCRKWDAFLHGADEVVCIRLEKANRDVIGMIWIELDIKYPKGVSLPVIRGHWYIEREDAVVGSREAKSHVITGY
jgi:hypothetical protein